MARFATVIESATALGTGINSNSGTTGGLFASFSLSAAGTARIRRLTLGVRAGSGAPTSQQVSIAAIRSTARGTATTSNGTVQQLDPNSRGSIMNVDLAWSTTPTLSGTALTNYVWEASFNTQSGADLPWELLEELWIQGSGNGLAFFNIGNALPTSHLYTFSAEWEE